MSYIRAKDIPAFARYDVSKDMRSQYAALPYRIVKNKVQILLITSRDSGRWLIPKGWPMDGRSPAEAAEIEAWEEAGAKGKIKKKVAGVYTYKKNYDNKRDVKCAVAVFPLLISKVHDKFPEQGQRRRKWFSPKKAAARVREPDLAKILRDFKPAKSKR